MRVCAVMWMCLFQFLTSQAIQTSETQHRTKAASEKQHDLWCYRCDSMVEGEKCLDLAGNYSYLHQKCGKEQKKCQVRRISMSTSTEEVTGTPKLWLLQRNCSETCEAGCIVIGERTKLHSCITCCDESNFCNFGSGASKNRAFVHFWLAEMCRAFLDILIKF
ncbi:uncharacterized protein [Euwallacea fornicatus]|uniref:uncharacterized protein n=1 Tax=Euwallacea fornicatus TaxID=995702 RepID=UPI0033906F5F